jgi:hypothetical protein
MTRRKMNRISVALLLVGLGSALAIYLAAGPEVDDPLLSDPRAARKLTHDLRVIGGKANVLSAEFQTWVSGLWHGEALAGTVAVLTVGATLGFRYVATFPSLEKDRPTVAHPVREQPGPRR